jgi:hypothetical protein
MSAAELRALPVVIHEPPLRRHRPSPSGGGADDEGDIETGEHSPSSTVSWNLPCAGPSSKCRPAGHSACAMQGTYAHCSFTHASTADEAAEASHVFASAGSTSSGDSPRGPKGGGTLKTCAVCIEDYA